MFIKIFLLLSASILIQFLVYNQVNNHAKNTNYLEETIKEKMKLASGWINKWIKEKQNPIQNTYKSNNNKKYQNRVVSSYEIEITKNSETEPELHVVIALKDSDNIVVTPIFQNSNNESVSVYAAFIPITKDDRQSVEKTTTINSNFEFYEVSPNPINDNIKISYKINNESEARIL